MSKEKMGEVVPLVTQEIFKTRWGYVIYSYEDYRNLKRLNFIFQKARLNASRWMRWVRKAPHNRIQKLWTRNEQGQKTGFTVGGPLPEPITCDLFSTKLVDVNREPLGRWFESWITTDHAVELEYCESRKPKENKDDVESAKMSSEEIKSLLEKAEEWEASLKKGTA